MSHLLWCAFERDPLFRYLFRSRWYAGRVVPLLFGATARDALRHGRIDVAVAHRQPLAGAIALYRRLGFEVRDEARPFRSGPPVWSMWRPATAPHADAGPEPGAPGENRPIRSKGR